MGQRRIEQRLARHRDAARATTDKPDPNEIITFRGWRMSRYTAAAFTVYEEHVGFEMDIVQGPYNKTVSGSAGTHDEDGVFDLAPYRWRLKVKVGRRNSFAIWHRPAIPGTWGEHEHGVLKRPEHLAPLAQWQLDVAYPNKWDGLDGNHHDDFPYHPVIERFDYNEWWHDKLLDKKIDGVNAYINRLVDKLSGARAKKKRLKKQRG